MALVMIEAPVPTPRSQKLSHEYGKNYAPFASFLGFGS